MKMTNEGLAGGAGNIDHKIDTTIHFNMENMFFRVNKIYNITHYRMTY